MTTRRNLLRGVAAAGVHAAIVGAAVGQSYPERPVKLVVPLAAGGTVDILARLIAQHLSPILGQNVVVENRPGGGTTIGLRAVAAADPDGYTLLFGSTGSIALSPALYKNLDFSWTKSLAPVALLATIPLVVVVGADVPANTISQFVAHAKAHPGKLSYGASLGTPPHLLGTFLRAKTGIDIVMAPYRGSAPATADLLAGQVQITTDTTAPLLPLIEQGRVRPIAVTSPTRLRELPNVPTLDESGLSGFPPYTWFGLMAPLRTPVNIIERLNAAANTALNSASLKTGLAKLGFEPRTGTPHDFAALIVQEVATWNDIVKVTGTTVD